MYRHYKYYIDRLITELKNPLKSDEWYYNLNLFQFQQVLIKFILVSTCTEFKRFATALSGVHCLNEAGALEDPANPKWPPRCLAAWLPECRWIQDGGRCAQYPNLWLLPPDGLDTSVLPSPFSRPIYPSALRSASTHICNTRFRLGKGGKEGGCYPTQWTYFNPPGLLCTWKTW